MPSRSIGSRTWEEVTISSRTGSKAKRPRSGGVTLPRAAPSGWVAPRRPAWTPLRPKTCARAGPRGERPARRPRRGSKGFSQRHLGVINASKHPRAVMRRTAAARPVKADRVDSLRVQAQSSSASTTRADAETRAGCWTPASGPRCARAPRLCQNHAPSKRLAIRLCLAGALSDEIIRGVQSR